MRAAPPERSGEREQADPSSAHPVSRRHALGSLLGVLGLPLLPVACEDPEPVACTDTRGLTEADRALRATMSYVDRSPDPKKTCSSCQHWVAAARPDLCGSCKLIKGPFHPRGSCKVFAPTAA
jgi:hypothetical protein